MEYPPTKALRPVSQKVNEALGDLPKGSFNFGLYFQKWFYVIDGILPQDGWKRKAPWNCPLSDETDLVKKQGPEVHFCHPNYLLDNLQVSLALFNGKNEYHRQVVEKPRHRDDKPKARDGVQKIDSTWDRAYIRSILQARHNSLDNCVQSFEKLGYRYLLYPAVLQSPLVLGLGGVHPTEKGFRFDWSLGLPMIPASGIKGVVRLAFLVNRLNESREEFAQEYGLIWKKLIEKGVLPAAAASLFGSGGEKQDEARRGKVIFLDAYPASVPRLKAEIMNCHYPDYLNPGEQNKRGPTEDQRPNPQKFWAIDPKDEKGEPLQFIFRIMLHRDLSEAQQDSLEKALCAALEEHGLGAKTAIGHGRFGRPFAPAHGGTSKAATNPLPGGKVPTAGPWEGPAPTAKLTAPTLEVWYLATLTWSPNNRTLTAAGPAAKATIIGSDLVPPELQPRLLNKRKAVAARVTVERVGNAFRIVRIEPAD